MLRTQSGAINAPTAIAKNLLANSKPPQQKIRQSLPVHKKFLSNVNFVFMAADPLLVCFVNLHKSCRNHQNVALHSRKHRSTQGLSFNRLWIQSWFDSYSQCERTDCVAGAFVGGAEKE